MYRQIFEVLDIGLLVVDRDYRIRDWNHWLATRTKISKDEAIGKNLFELYPELNNKWFVRNCKSLFTFGNFVFSSQKLHRYLIPIPLSRPIAGRFEYMQQNCTIGPVRDLNDPSIGSNKIELAFIMIQDVTDLAEYERRLTDAARVDGLTGAINRSYFDALLESEFARHKRYGNVFSVALIDIDYFKTINDVYGHLTGDKVLKELVKQIQQRIRRTDIFARYGGEEFCIILPETDGDSAVVFAEEIRKRVADMSVETDEHSIGLTVSIGVSTLGTSDVFPSEVLRRADSAMYRAKDAGRNKVISESTPAPQIDHPGRICEEQNIPADCSC